MVAHSECYSYGGDDPEKAKELMRNMMGPGHVDQMIRGAISACWMVLPNEKKTIKGLESEIRRLVDRALEDLKEDADAFGVSTGS